MAGRVPAGALAGCWLFYLTLAHLGQDFLSFQWDVLLLESGLLACLLSPWRRRPAGDPGNRSLLGILLGRWLLFRLMLESGVVKLMSGDPTWRNLTALQYHFETQPLPNGVSWYVHQLPAELLKGATAAMFAIELVIPFLFFAPRRVRLFAGAATVGLQLAIVATGNYGCFNWLTIVLCLTLLDDQALGRWIRWRPGRFPGLRRRPESDLAETKRPIEEDIGDAVSRPVAPLPVGVPESPGRLRPMVRMGYAFVVLLVGLAQLDDMLGSRSSGGGPVTWLRSRLEPFRVVNPYGLFAVMTTRRPELVIEGSLDGVEWRAYQFKYKPGPPDLRPPVVPLHMPRLDWQMWFAALQEGHPPRWLGGLIQRLFERSPSVVALLANEPFPDQAPRYLRVLAFDYHFTNRTMRRNTGQWWMAANRRYYVPIMRREEEPSPAP